MNNRLETAVKANAAEARLTKQKVLKELKQQMEGLIQQIENDNLWISDLKELHNQVAETVAKVTAAPIITRGGRKAAPKRQGEAK